MGGDKTRKYTSDWAKQAKKKIGEGWGGRYLDGPLDNLDRKKLLWYKVENITGKRVKKRNTSGKLIYNYPSWVRRLKFKSYKHKPRNKKI